jgi:hypothetical protein
MRFKVSMSRPREQILCKYPLFPHSAVANLFFSKIGKYGVGFRACYHVSRCGSIFATLEPIHSGGMMISKKQTF